MFAELRDYAAQHNDGALRLRFSSPIACQEDETVSRTAAEHTDNGGDEGFVPDLYASPIVGQTDAPPVLVVTFGSVGFASIEVCKYFDSNNDGQVNDGDSLIPDWPVTLTVPESVPIPDDISLDATPVIWEKLVAVFGDGIELMTNRQVHRITGENGCTTFHVLVPNVRPVDDGVESQYTIQEEMPNGNSWINTSALNVKFDVESQLSYDNDDLPIIQGVVTDRNDEIVGNTFNFTNVCHVVARFGTKGYWHNKNGLQELTIEDRDYVNGLAPYSSASPYFGAGDEPFDGFYQGGKPVDAAYQTNEKNEVESIWNQGSWQAEVSHFLTDNNGNSTLYAHKEQLAQQLLAFIFNTRHRPDNDGVSGFATVEVDGVWVSFDDLINEALEAWSNDDPVRISTIKDILDDLNNNDDKEDDNSSLIIIPGEYEDCPAPFPQLSNN